MVLCLPVPITEASLCRCGTDIVACVVVAVTDDVKLLMQRPGQILLAAVEGQLVRCCLVCGRVGSVNQEYEKVLIIQSNLKV